MLSKKYILTNIAFLLLAISSYSAEITAVQNGDWNNTTTWYNGTVPTTDDEVIIPAGITVSSSTDFSQKDYYKLDVKGTLNINGNYNLDKWDKLKYIVTVFAGGLINVTGNLNIETYLTELEIKDGGTIKIGGNVDGSLNDNIDFNNYGKVEILGNMDIKALDINNHNTGEIIVKGYIKGSTNTDIRNYGYIETDKDIDIDSKVFYNYEGASILVHGSIIGTANLEVHNYGIITIDSNFEVKITDLTNYTTGQVIVFGDMNIGDGSGVVNYGFVQVKNLSLTNRANSDHGFENNGTLIVLDAIKSTDKCPLCGHSGNLFYSESNTANSTCGTGDDKILCGDYLDEVGSDVPKGRRLWLNASFVGYGNERDGDKIYQWMDLSNNFSFKMREENEANQPTLKNNKANNINYNPVMDFSQHNVHFDLDDNYIFSDENENGFVYILVSKPEPNNNTSDQFVFDFGSRNARGYGISHINNNIKTYTPYDDGGAEIVYTNAHENNPIIIGQVINWENTQKLYVNGYMVKSKSISLPNIDNTNINNQAEADGAGGPFTIGGQSTNPATNEFNGQLAELIIYSYLPHDTVINSTESFLAIKYGISLKHNYTNYQDKTVYSLDGTYNNGIAGIAREDVNKLHQRISSALGNNENLTITVGTEFHPYDQRKLSANVNSNSSYLLWGHNGEAANNDKIYKVQTTNFNQKVTLAFKVPDLGTTIPKLSISGDDSFTTASSINATYKNDTLFFEHTFANNSIEYFKLNFECPPASREPGVGINTEVIEPSAQLHIKENSAAPRGVLLPSLTDAEMDVLGAKKPETGTIIFNTTINRYMFYNGSGWSNIGGFKVEANNASMSAGDYIGEIRYNSESNTLFIWDGSKWNEIRDAQQ